MYLNCHSYYSLRYGTIPVEELVQQAKSLDIVTLALTDINTTIGVYDFVKACKANGIKPVVGIEFRNDNQLQFVGLAKTTEGFGELCKFLTECNMSKVPVPSIAPAFNQVIVMYPFEKAPNVLREWEYVGIRPDQLLKLYGSPWNTQRDKLLVHFPLTHRNSKEYALHKVLRAVDRNTLLSMVDEKDCCKGWEKLITEDRIRQGYKEYPELIANTEQVLHGCSFEFDFKSPKNKKHYTTCKEEDRKLLERLALEGLKHRYGINNREAYERVKKELLVIDQLGFAAYFLITWDIIQYSISKGYYHVGRGSGANSIVAYCLGITDICPIELNLYFERFLNPGRTSPPDFDIDWSWKNRDDILRYIFERFGAAITGFTGTIVQFKYRSIIRELGKVFGLPKEELDLLSRTKQDFQQLNSVAQQVHAFGLMLQRFPNQLSMHSCGILISEAPITSYTALELPPKGFATVQIDMHIAEDIGLEKLDILSQRGIGHINDSVEIIEKNRGVKIDIRDIAVFKDHPVCNEWLKEGKTIGCFYIESPAMRGLLRRLKCDNYKVLVAASSVIRPGVAQSGMMGEYIFRHNHPDQFEYFHTVFEEQLGETYGIMVYQEDVIKIAHHFAGLNLSDADILRRAMSGKSRSRQEFENVKKHYFQNCKQKGYPDQLTKEVYRQIESFAGYSFCKAHSASYAVESYQSLYLKVHYPIEFMVAVINNFGGFYRTEVYFHEAKMAGGILCPPCVNSSEYLTTVRGKDIFIGFIHLEKLPKTVAEFIPQERQANGPFLSLEDFITRVPLGIEALQILIFIGAFRFTGKTKNELILAARMRFNKHLAIKAGPMLFEEPLKEFALPVLERSVFEDAFDEIELLGFPISYSPFELLEAKQKDDVKTMDLLNLQGQTVTMIGYLIARKEVPIKSGLMYFGTWIDSEGGYFDSTHFSDSLKSYPFQGGGCYELTARIDVEHGFPSLLIKQMKKLPFIADPRYADDKDKRYEIHKRMQEDVSLTHRAPYPSVNEVGLTRQSMNLSVK